MSVVIFDLDGTLYDVEQFFSGAFAHISEYLSRKYPVSHQEIYKRLWDLWKERTSMYPRLFDDLVNFFGLKVEVRSLVMIFNSYAGELKPYPDVVPTLKSLKEGNHKLGIITDGDPERQERKVESLGIIQFFDEVIFTKKLGSPKPSKVPFQEAIRRFKVNSEEFFYVGDNPLIDFEGAKEAGFKTVRVLRGEFRNLPKSRYEDYSVGSFKELPKIVVNG